MSWEGKRAAERGRRRGKERRWRGRKTLSFVRSKRRSRREKSSSSLELLLLLLGRSSIFFPLGPESAPECAMSPKKKEEERLGFEEKQTPFVFLISFG